TIQNVPQVSAIKRLNHIEQLNRFFGFVGLEVADQMELRLRIDLLSFGVSVLRKRFLNAIFTKKSNACLEQRSDTLKPDRFCYRHQGYFLGISSRSPGGRCDTLLHPFETL